MPLQPLAVTLTDWQKRDALKRVREQYQEELTRIEGELVELLTKGQEADLIAAYLGEQAEVKSLRPDPKEVEVRQRRRDHLGQILDRLDAVVKELPAVQAPPPGGGRPGAGGGIRRY